MKGLPWLVAAVLGSRCAVAQQQATIPETPGRYQIVATQLGSGNDSASLVLKIDTATGRVWRLVTGEDSIYFAELASLPLSEIMKEDRAERSREAKLGQAKAMELWCLRNPDGGTLDVTGEKITVSKAARDQKLREAREEIARLSRPAR